MADQLIHKIAKGSHLILANVTVSGMGRRLWLVLLVGSLALTGCRSATKTLEDAVRPPAETPETAPEVATSTPAATPSPPPGAQAPTPGPSAQGAALPEHLVRQWEPMSNVLLAFGPMTVTAGEVKWGSGQTSPYTLVTTDGGFLLKLEAVPQFYDTPNPYIKLIPKTNESGAVTTVEVAFFESETQMQKDEYIMYGSYFVN